MEVGLAATAPVKSFPANAFGIYDMAGNVWEIVADRYHPKAYSLRMDGAINPTGPDADSLRRLRQRLPTYVTRGGSFLCSDVWCSGYQPGSRQAGRLVLNRAKIGRHRPSRTAKQFAQVFYPPADSSP